MKKETKITKYQILLLIATIAYIIIFGIYYLMTKNYEFLGYVLVLFIILALMIFLHLKYNLTSGVLTGISIWGLIHMAGGSLYINGTKLYALMIFNLYNSPIQPEFRILKFDQFAHFYCYVFITILMFYILKPYLKEKFNWFAISVILVFIGMGIGALNEILEFIAVIVIKDTGVGGYYNNLLDIIFNTLGAIAAAIYIYFKENYKGIKK